MLTVAEALVVVADSVTVCPSIEVPCQDAWGMVLAEAVASDVDSPPCDRSVVDGYAVCSADLRDGSAELTVLEELPAGRLPKHAVARGTAVRVMTGAPIPPGADAVVMVEHGQQAQHHTDVQKQVVDVQIVSQTVNGKISPRSEQTDGHRARQ